MGTAAIYIIYGSGTVRHALGRDPSALGLGIHRFRASVVLSMCSIPTVFGILGLVTVIYQVLVSCLQNPELR